MAETQNLCSNCGTALAPSAPAGLCAKCVFEQMLEPGPAGDELSPPDPGSGSTPARMFGGYELLGEIARGGMGVVYRARQAQLKRIVALKVIIAGDMASGEFVRRFRTEAEAAASLDHPNIVPIYEIGDNEGQPFFSMKLVEGQTLAQRITSFQSASGNRSAAILVAKLAHAVHYAHQHGILHRDLKPTNVLLDLDDEPHLTDFGLAKLTESGTTITKTRAVLGTPSYMAPEQARGETRHLTTAVDVYGLGAILYELLTGRPPFAGGTTVETIRQVLEAEPRRPTALDRGIERDLETICLKCLEKQPLQRYGSAEALAHDLERWMAREPIEARPASTVERVVKWARRKPAIATLLCGLGLSLLIGFGVASWQSLARQRALIQSRRALYAAQLGLVQQAWSDGHVSRARALLKSLRPDPGAEDLRGFEWRYLWRLCRDQSFFTLADEQNPVQSVAASPDGRLLALAGGMKYVSLWSIASRTVLARLPCEAGNRSVVFSTDGSLVAAAGYECMIRVWDVATGALKLTLTGHKHSIERIAFSPDGKLLASASRPDGTIKLWDLTAAREIASFGGLPNDRPSLAFSPDGHLLAWGASDSTIRLTSLASREELARLAGHSGSIVYLAFSHNGRMLASAGTEGLAKVWDVPSRRELATLSGHKAWVTSVEFSPDDESLATTCIDGTIKLWNIESKSELTTFKGHEMWVNNAVFLPDGRTLVSGSDDRTMKMWDASRPPQADAFDLLQAPEAAVRPIVVTNYGVISEPALLRDDSGAVLFTPGNSRLLTVDNRPVIQAWDLPLQRLSAAFAIPDDVAFTTIFFTDGKRVATAGRDGKVRLWDPVSGACLAQFEGENTAITTLGLSADGRKMAGGGLTGKLWIWDVSSRALESTISFGDGRLTALCYVPKSGTWLAGVRKTRDGDHLCRFDPSARSVEVLPTVLPEWVTSIVMSPDGSLVATSCRDSAIYLWRPATLQAVGVLRGHSGYVTSVAFSSDGLTLASASNDGTVKLWSVLSQLELVTLPGHIAAGTRLAFSPDGAELAACGEDGVIRIWRAAPFSVLQ